MVKIIKTRHARGKDYSIVVVSEGVTLSADSGEGDFVVTEAGKDEFGHVKLGGIGQLIAHEVEARTGFETRVTVLGHLQRGGTPTAFDRVLGTRFGAAAIDLIHQGDYGKMVSLQGNKIVAIPVGDGVGELKMVDDDLYDLGRVFFG